VALTGNAVLATKKKKLKEKSPPQVYSKNYITIRKENIFL
jgi:hypothetical protein